jgi:hypothetical protein
MITGRNDDRGVLAAMKLAALNNEPVFGLTHRHYKYPARFSPKFVRAAIEAFSKPGDLVLDPYMGGGTTMVESMALGRQGVGCDINSLALFVARAKTTPLTSTESRQVETWARVVVPTLSYHSFDARLAEVICETRTRNLDLPNARPIKKFIALALVSLDTLSSEAAREFVRCVLLNTTQWALNGKKQRVSLGDFRTRVTEVAIDMLSGSASLDVALSEAKGSHASPILIHDSAEHIARCEPFKDGKRAQLVVTSPPYPGVHVLYHRWQVDGRRETPAPYWIANCLDGQGEAYYTFGARKEKRKDSYFEQSLKTLQAIRTVMSDGAVMVQMIAFSNPSTQLKRYLRNMAKAGFREVRTAEDRPARTWRSVPGRSWHANYRGDTSSAREVALLHVAD